MDEWLVLVVVAAVAGALGGLVAALTSEAASGKEEGSASEPARRLGVVSQMVVGAIAAIVYLALSSRLTDVSVIGGDGKDTSDAVLLTVGDVATAVLVGLVGPKWLALRADRKFFQAATVEAAGRQPDREVAMQISSAQPRQALMLVREKLKDPQ